MWRTEPDLAKADPVALRVGRYYERTAGMYWHSAYGRITQNPRAFYDLARAGEGYWSQPGALAARVARVLDGAVLVAANPAFDAGFLAAFLRHHGQAPTWHYRLRDIGSMAWAYLWGRELTTRRNLGEDEGTFTGRRRPDLPAIDASTDAFAEAMGVNRARFERHSALGDCRLLAAKLDVIEGCRP
jgi:hypothetical protein